MENAIIVAKQNYEKKIGGEFKPDANTYNRTGITPKRMGMLLKGKNKKPLTFQEAIQLSELFGVQVNLLVENKQKKSLTE